MHRYIEKILRAKVYDVAVETPLDPAPACRDETHNPAYRLFAGGSETSG
jgi:threonine dehydratase